MDATYKTTKYELALFFIAVKTNVGYSVVGEFVVQSETTDQVAEALSILSSWNPEWHTSILYDRFFRGWDRSYFSCLPLMPVIPCVTSTENSRGSDGLKSENMVSPLKMQKYCWASCATVLMPHLRPLQISLLIITISSRLTIWKRAVYGSITSKWGSGWKQHGSPHPR